MKSVLTKNLLLATLVITTLLTCTSSFSQSGLNNGLMAYYPFNGNALDSSGNNNNPIYNNATLTTDRFGNANSAYSFNGLNSYMDIPNSSSLQMGKNASISLWVKPTGFYSGTCHGNYMLCKGHEGGGALDALFSDGGYDSENGINGCAAPVDTTKETFYSSLGGYFDPKLMPVHTNTWYHVVEVCDSTTAHIYINGKLIRSNSTNTVPFNTPYDLFIGRYVDVNTTPYWLNGVLDDIRIYNRAIDSSEVRELYTAPNPAPTKPPVVDSTNKCNAQLVLTASASNKLFQTSAFLNDPNAGPNGDTSGTELYAFAWTANSINIPNYYGRSLIKYDISQIPVGAVVQSAKLYLYAKQKNINGVLGSPTYGPNNTALLQKVYTPWTLAHVNYYTNLSVDNTTPVKLPESTSPAENYVADITAYAQSWVNKPDSNYGILFRMQTESDPYNSMIFESGLAADTSKRPRLEICYTIPPPPDTTHQTLTLYGDSSNTGFKGVVFVKDSLSGLNIIDTTGKQICAFSWGTDSINITYKNGWTIIQYDVSQIPPTAVIDSAAIYFFAKLDNLDGATGSPTIGPNNEGILNRILDYWETGNNTHPPVVVIDTLVPVDLPPSTSPTEDYKANITPFVKTWVKNPSSNHGMTLNLKHPNTGNNSLIFESSLSANKARRPKLTISFTVPKITPIVLSSFTVSVIKSPYTQVNFATTNETNASTISLERSYNGIDYTVAATFIAKGNVGTNNYNYTDKVAPVALKVYYRLKATNKDGSYRFSNIVTAMLADNSKGISVSVYPNPIRSNALHVNLYLLKDEALTISIYNMSGKLVAEQKVQGTKGLSSLSIDAFKTFSSGIYSMNVTSSSEVVNKKIIKVND